MNRALKLTSNKLLSLVILSLLGVLLLSWGNSASALSGNNFKPGRIIDDTVFFNASSMSSNEIQQFLEAKVPVCDSNGEQPYAGTTRADYGASRGYPPPYTCLKDYTQNITAKNPEDSLCNGITAANNVRASEIIYRVAQSCGVSPKVLIVLLQKEQSLVTDDWPWSIQYRSATGYGCPDTGPNYSANCDASYYGFFNQVYLAARVYKYYAKYPDSFNHIAGRNNYILYNPNTDCGGSNVFIENQATAGLYNYTPYQPNAAALNNLYGNGNNCSAYGNRNFWRMFNDWFGSTEGTPFFRLEDGNAIYINGADNTYYLIPNNSMLEAYGYWRTVHKIAVVPSSYIDNRTYSGIATYAAQYETDEIFFVNSGKRHHVPNLSVFRAYGTPRVTKLIYGNRFLLNDPGEKASTVFKKVGDNKLYLAEDGTKRHLTSRAYSTLGDPPYNSRNVSTYSDYFVDYIKSGGPLLGDGETALNTSTGRFYINISGVLHPSSTLQIGKDWGLKTYYEAPDNLLSQLPTGTTVGRFISSNSGNKYLVDNGSKLKSDANSDQHLGLNAATYAVVPDYFLSRLPTSTYKGTLKKYGSPAVYEAQDLSLFRIGSVYDFTNLGYLWGDVVTFTEGFVSTLNDGGGISYADTRLVKVKDSPAIYLIDQNGTTKRHIPSLSIFQSYGFLSKDVITISAETANHYTDTGAISKLIRMGDVYWLVDGGKKYPIPSQYLSDNIYGFDFGASTVLSSENILAITETYPLTNLVRNPQTGATYKIESGKKRWFPNIASFENNGADWSQVRTLSAEYVDSIPEGPQME